MKTWCTENGTQNMVHDLQLFFQEFRNSFSVKELVSLSAFVYPGKIEWSILVPLS